MYIAFERLGEPVLISKKIGMLAEGSDGSYQEKFNRTPCVKVGYQILEK